MKDKVLIGVVVLLLGYVLYDFMVVDNEKKELKERQEALLKEQEKLGDKIIGTRIGDHAPDVELIHLNHESHKKISDLKGKPAMINFWGSWCPPCREEMPDIQKLHDNELIDVFSINMVETEKKFENIQKFIDEYNLNFDVWLDYSSIAAQEYRISPLPTTYFINKEGIITGYRLGYMTYEEMLIEVEKAKE